MIAGSASGTAVWSTRIMPFARIIAMSTSRAEPVSARRTMG
jgi:hypothetical protein